MLAEGSMSVRSIEHKLRLIHFAPRRVESKHFQQIASGLVEGKRLSEDEYEHLDPTLRQGLKQKGDTLLRAMSGMVRKLNSAEQSLDRKSVV